MGELCKIIENKSFGHLKEILNIGYRDNGTVIDNDCRGLISNLDTLPFPDKTHLISDRPYTTKELSVIITSRGCPFNCAYCGAKNTWGRRVRHRSIANVMREIEEIIKSTGSRQIFFWDDSFTVDRKWVIEFCQNIIEKNYNFEWGITTRVDLVDKELLETMYRAGCRSVDFGVESGSPSMLEKIDKGISIEKVKNAFSLCNKVGIDTNAFFMIGFPEETEEDIRDTVCLIRKLPSTWTTVSIFTPYPGTALYDKAKELGLIDTSIDYGKLSHQSPDNYFTKNISKERFGLLSKKIFRMTSRQSRIRYYKNRILSFLRRLLTHE